MKILLSSISGNDKTEALHYHRVLQRLGHEVCWISAPARGGTIYPDLYVTQGFDVTTSLEDLISHVGFEPDIFLYIEPRGLIPKGIERIQCPTACVLSDCHRDLDSRLRLAQFFDHVFLYHRNHIHYFNDHPTTHVHWLPYACDLNMFCPTGEVRNLDVAFIGQLFDANHERFRVIGEIAKRWKINEQRVYLQHEIPHVYSQAKIVLNLPLADDLNFRTFEAMSCGAMLLTRRGSNGQDLLFQEEKHFAAFSSKEELLDKIQYYLSHPKEREAIAAVGLAEVQQAHRLEQRIEQLLAIVHRAPNKVAPVRRMSPRQIDQQYAWLYEYWRAVEPGLTLVKEARRAGRPWLPLLLPATRSALRVAFR